jgi:hypothetical protein
MCVMLVLVLCLHMKTTLLVMLVGLGLKTRGLYICENHTWLLTWILHSRDPISNMVNSSFSLIKRLSWSVCSEIAYYMVVEILYQVLGVSNIRVFARTIWKRWSWRSFSTSFSLSIVASLSYYASVVELVVSTMIEILWFNILLPG